MDQTRQAFVLRIAPSGIDRVQEALRDGEAIIGWSEASELLNPDLEWQAFRGVLRRQYYQGEKTLRRAGAAAGNMWRFMRDMKPGDLLVVPHGSEFYVARVEGEPTHVPERIEEDTAFRRKVAWLNNGQPIPRAVARAALQSRMKTQGTCAYATDLLEEIEECVELAGRTETPSFATDLQARLVREALEEIRSGRLDSFAFESLIKTVLVGMGAEEARVVPRAQDKGADILATFLVAGAFRLLVAVQAKHYRQDPPVGREAVEQVIQGVEAESADLGMVVTSGTISDEAAALAST